VVHPSCRTGQPGKRGPPAAAPGKPALDECVDALRTGYREDNYVAVAEALAAAESLRWDYEEKDFRFLVVQIGKGIKHADTSIALLSVKSLGTLGIPGSSRYLRSLLHPRNDPDAARWKLHFAAIEAAGAIHDPESAGQLERILRHPETELAVAAAKALGQFAVIDRKKRLDLVRRIANALARLEKQSPNDPEERIHVVLVTKAIQECVLALTREVRNTYVSSLPRPPGADRAPAPSRPGRGAADATRGRGTTP